MTTPDGQQSGPDNPAVRGDMVFFETPNDGAVFAVGSITWFGSLSHNDYDNPVSRITDNVLRAFASDEWPRTCGQKVDYDERRATSQRLARQALRRDRGRLHSRHQRRGRERMCDEILAARRIACFGVGREGLMMRALCMRLMHLGFDAHVVGDMTTPPIGPGDLLMISAGPGAFSTALALLGVARRRERGRW